VRVCDLCHGTESVRECRTDFGCVAYSTERGWAECESNVNDLCLDCRHKLLKALDQAKREIISSRSVKTIVPSTPTT
jgi:hypothetical protein